MPCHHPHCQQVQRGNIQKQKGLRSYVDEFEIELTSSTLNS
jgi:hypothetical protein